MPATLRSPRLEPLQDSLMAWAAASGRDLPWRHTRDPWAVLVSEAMLQQTQVPRVVPKYRAFMEQFPTAAATAAVAVGGAGRGRGGAGVGRAGLQPPGGGPAPGCRCRGRTPWRRRARDSRRPPRPA